MSDGFLRMYRGWDGNLVHPGSSAGLGGPGSFRNAAGTSFSTF